MTSDPPLDHCRTPSNISYQVLSGVMAGQFTLGLLLNLSVLYTFLFRFRFWRNQSVFLFNIVLADLLLLFCLPFKAHHFRRGLRRSEDDVVCKAMLFMLFLNRGASVAFLITLTIDRYCNVVLLGRRNLVKALKKTPQVSVVIWLLVLPLAIPATLETFDCCNSHGRNDTELGVQDTVREVIFFSQILLPFIILVYCTVRMVRRLRRKTVGERARLRRAVVLVLSVVLVFSLCFLPCAVARAALLAVRLQKKEVLENQVVQVYDGLMVLSYMDCLLDPLVYCFCNSGFKDAYVATFCPRALQKVFLRTDPGLGTTSNTTTHSGTRSLSLPALRSEAVAVMPGAAQT